MANVHEMLMFIISKCGLLERQLTLDVADAIGINEVKRKIDSNCIQPNLKAGEFFFLISVM